MTSQMIGIDLYTSQSRSILEYIRLNELRSYDSWNKGRYVSVRQFIVGLLDAYVEDVIDPILLKARSKGEEVNKNE